MRRAAVRLAAVAAMVAIVLTAASALALSVSDGKETSYALDIRTVKLVKPKAHTFTWTTRTWGTWGWKKGPSGAFPLTLSLDVTGTSAVDDVVKIYYDTYSKAPYCELRKPSGKLLDEGTLRRPDTSSVACTFSTKGLTFQRLHWRATIQLGVTVDAAPNSGWAKGV